MAADKIWVPVGRKSLTAVTYQDEICHGLLEKCDGYKEHINLLTQIIKLNPVTEVYSLSILSYRKYRLSANQTFRQDLCCHT